MSWQRLLVQVATGAFVSTGVCAVALSLYERQVREPRTPRLAVVDVARLYAAAEQQAKARVLRQRGDTAVEDGASSTVGVAAGSADLAALGEVGRFGPNLQAVLQALANDCRCAIVATAAIVGRDASLPDYTRTAADRLGLPLEAAP